MGRHDPETLRIDSWLHHVRLASTRTHAQELCEGGKVHRNGVRVKASTRVRVGDHIELSGKRGPRVFEVLGCPATRVGATQVTEYLSDITPPEVIAKQQSAQDAFLGVRDRGAGRPTKRERRHIEQWLSRNGLAGGRTPRP